MAWPIRNCRALSLKVWILGSLHRRWRVVNILLQSATTALQVPFSHVALTLTHEPTSPCRHHQRPGAGSKWPICSRRALPRVLRSRECDLTSLIRLETRPPRESTHGTSGELGVWPLHRRLRRLAGGVAPLQKSYATSSTWRLRVRKRSQHTRVRSDELDQTRNSTPRESTHGPSGALGASWRLHRRLRRSAKPTSDGVCAKAPIIRNLTRPPVLQSALLANKMIRAWRGPKVLAV